MSVSFVCTTDSVLAPERLFDLSLDIGAHTSSMQRSRERAVAGVTSGLISLGEEVTWRAWHFGVPIRMTSRITAFDRPRSFVDEQKRGPFLYFRHEHRFEPRSDGGGTRMTDHVSFAAPFGPLGRLVEKLVLARYLERLIRQRNAYLQSISA
jgi:ligand-binding SRPBCC domain-containing protein